MQKNCSNEVVMIRPAGFFYNEQTATNNAYQQNDSRPKDEIQRLAKAEFDELVKKLRSAGIVVQVIEDEKEPSTPDSIFPNNWFSTHGSSALIIYPMYAQNRRAEVDKFFKEVKSISSKKTEKEKTIDYRKFSDKNEFLEGTGSMVLDRANKIAYCAISERSDEKLFDRFCKDMGYKGVSFHATQDGQLVYHTNVIMGIAESFAIICLEAIEKSERQLVKDTLEKAEKEIIEISLAQVKEYLGNTLELCGKQGKRFLAMSKSAYDSLHDDQRKIIEKYDEIIYSDISTIEFYGGGSVRCMLAEIF